MNSQAYKILKELTILRKILWQDLIKTNYSLKLFRKIKLLDEISYELILGKKKTLKQISPAFQRGIYFLLNYEQEYNILKNEIEEL